MIALEEEAMTTAIRYEDDVVTWSSEQARLLREGRFDLLDIAHLAAGLQHQATKDGGLLRDEQ